ncbi:MAG: toprim domain-containing protein [Armatimonadetes bacterium]|nr:toprim domain-containing protein [Armatimonadota bacterium]
MRRALVELGVLNEKGREHFLGSVVVPLEHPELGIVGLYGRRLNPRSKVRHLFLPGPKRGVLNWQTLRGADEVYLVESVLDAFSLWVAGVRNVTCLHGTGGLSEDTERFLRASGIRELRLCLDADEAGATATERLEQALNNRFKIGRVLLPDGADPNGILVDHGADVLRSFLKCVSREPEEDSGSRDVPLAEDFEDGFRLTFETVEYTITPRPPFTGRLQVSMRARTRETQPRKFLDRCDLTSARSRSTTLRGLSRKLGLERQMAENQLAFILDATEAWVESLADDSAGSKKAPTLTEAQKVEALEVLQSVDLVDRILGDMEDLGYVGEERAKLLTYLIGVSRKLENPLSGIIQSQSGAGKSGLAHLVAQMTPPEDVIHYSRVSAHALPYSGKDHFKRKLLVMEERVGGESADYYIRVLQSAHKIRQAVVIKDLVTGKMKTEEFEVEGPIAYLETTTERRVNHENATRCFEIVLDETEEQTRRIHARQRSGKSLARLKRTRQRETILERHHNMQRLLEPVLVVIPYVELLSFPSRWLRTRRDHERFLCLIEVSAFLHQHQRVRKTVTGPDGEEIAYIEATLDDYRLAYDLAQDVLSATFDELSAPARELLGAARALEGSFTRRELRQLMQWPQRRLHETLDELVDMEYLTVVAGGTGKTYLYAVADIDEAATAAARPCLGSLTHPDELARRLGPP